MVHCGELGVEDVDDWLRLLGVEKLVVSPERWWVNRLWYEMALHAIMEKPRGPIVWDDAQWERTLRLAAWYDLARERVGPLKLSEEHRRRIQPLVFARRAVEEAYREEADRLAEIQGFQGVVSGGDGDPEVCGSGGDR